MRIGEAITYLDEREISTIEPTLAAQDAWVQHVNELGEASIYTKGDNWYVGANIPGKPRVFLPYIGFPQYVEKCREVAAADYAGFDLA